MGRILLFDEPLDLAKVEPVLDDDEFLSLAFFMTGREPIWREGLRQVAEIAQLLQAADRNWNMLGGILKVLVERAATFQHTAKFLDEIVAALGILPGTGFFEEIKMAHLHKVDPQAWQRKKNQDWVKGHIAWLKLRGRPIPNQGPDPAGSLLPPQVPR